MDHVEGTLAEPFVALDGFLSHAWEVTLIGAPRQAAIQCPEAPEKSLRDWYGGAIGVLDFHGDMNTVLTLRAAPSCRAGPGAGGSHTAAGFRPRGRGGRDAGAVSGAAAASG